MYDLALAWCEEIVVDALPVAIVFEIVNLGVSTFLRAAFGGRLWFGR